jgi:hypothetical protein
MKRSLAVVLFMVLAIGASAQTPAAPAPGGILLKVQVSGKPESTYTLTRLRSFAERTVKARGHGGEEHSYTGVALGDLLLVPDDKHPSRWVRQVESLAVVESAASSKSQP